MIEEEEKKRQVDRSLIEMNEKKIWLEMAREQKAKDLHTRRELRYRDRVA
jgi:hypothetical protein